MASCGCGWQGGAHPPTEHGYESAVEEWEDDHARQLLAPTVPDDVRSLIRDTEQSVSALLDKRPLAGVEALRSLATWAGATVDRLPDSLRATAPGTITKGPGHQPPGRALGLQLDLPAVTADPILSAFAGAGVDPEQPRAQ